MKSPMIPAGLLLIHQGNSSSHVRVSRRLSLSASTKHPIGVSVGVALHLLILRAQLMNFTCGVLQPVGAGCLCISPRLSRLLPAALCAVLHLLCSLFTVCRDC